MAKTAEVEYSHERYRPTHAEISGWEVTTVPSKRLPQLSGKCPKCHHQHGMQLTDVVVTGGLPSAADDTPAPSVTRLIECGCNMEHGQPPGVNGGCGRFWLATLTLRDGAYQLSVEDDPKLFAAASTLSSAIEAQNKSIQASAEKWTAGVAALYGLFSLSGVATAKDALSGLHTGAKAGIAVAFLFGILLAATSVILGYLAAYNWPIETDVSDNTKLLAWQEKRAKYATDAAHRLRSAVACALFSLAALSVTPRI